MSAEKWLAVALMLALIPAIIQVVKQRRRDREASLIKAREETLAFLEREAISSGIPEAEAAAISEKVRHDWCDGHRGGH